jgi:hypothetical protein
MPRYRKLDNDPYINVDGVRVWAGDDGWFDVESGSRAEQVLLAGGAVSDTAAAASSGGSGGGTDWINVTEEDAPTGGKRVATYTTDDGIVWSRIYGPDGSLQSETALGTRLTRTWSYTAGGLGYISAGAERKSGGAWTVNVADMAGIKTDLAAMGAAALAPRFYVQDFNNGVADSGLEVEWDRGSACLRGIGGAQMKAMDWYGSAAYNSFPAESGDLVVLSFPGWLAGPRTEFTVEAFGTSGSAGWPTLNAYMGGVFITSSNETSNGQRTSTLVNRWWNNNSLTSQLRINTSGAANAGAVATGYGGAQGTVVYSDPAVDTGAASVNVALRAIMSTAADNYTILRAALLMRN